MLEYFQPLINYIHQHPQVGELIAFLVAFAESLPLIGTVIPGSITMTAIGTLVGAGILPGIPTLAWASLGAFTGDTIGFWVGYRFTETIPNIWPFRKHPKWLKKSEAFFEKHGGKSIILGRFVGPARSTIPMVAGLMKMKWLRFMSAALPSAILWAILYLVPGILLGALALELPPHVATEFVVIGLVVIVALWLLFWALQYFFTTLAHWINAFIDNAWDLLIRHRPSRPFIRLIAVKGKPTDHYQLTLSILTVITLGLFLWLFYAVVTHASIININRPIFYLMQSLRSESTDTFFILITLLASPVCMITIGILLSIGLAWLRQWRSALHLLALDLITAAATNFAKHFSHSPRPTGFQIVKSSSSFPSGHTIMTFVILCFIAYLTGKLCKKSLRWIPYTIAIVLILSVAESRLYLGAHWFTDVIGSLLMGSFILFAVLVNYRRRARKQFEKTRLRNWLLIVAIGILLPWCIWSLKLYNHEKYRYTPLWPKIQMRYQQWWQHPLYYLPIYRLSRFGNPIQPFNLQWVGNIHKINTLLTQHGWVPANPRHTVKSMLNRFTSKKPEYHMPVLPWLYHDKAPILILIKHIERGKKIIEFRLWKSDTKFTDSKTPLWIGTVNFHVPPENLFALHHFQTEISLQETGGIRQLVHSIRKKYQLKHIHIPPNRQPEKVRVLGWDGHILVIRPK